MCLSNSFTLQNLQTGSVIQHNKGEKIEKYIYEQIDYFIVATPLETFTLKPKWLYQLTIMGYYYSIALFLVNNINTLYV